MRILEKALIAIILIGIGFKILALPGGNEFLLIGVVLLACLYFYLNFALSNGIGFKGLFRKASYQGIGTVRIIGAAVMGISFAIILMGILFKLLSLVGGSEMLIIGSSELLLVLSIAVASYLFGKTQIDGFYRNLFIRGFIMLALGVSLFFTPTNSIIRFFHRQEPDFAELLIKARENPDDPEIQHQLDEALQHRGQGD